MLGAAGLPDIGNLFPDNDPAWSGADSRELVVHVMARLAERGLVPVHADVTVVAQRPRLADRIPPMRQVLADCLGLDSDRANIKATTTESLGPMGRGEGIAAHAVVLLDERREASV
jgi:2-C-methyl-D-erythritol 2,4-cyclodiphosphate synthase